MQIRSRKGLQHAKALVKAHWLRGLPLLVLATAAQADCAADFARDNRLKPEAGPYRIQIDALLPMAHTQVVEVAPPNSMRQTMQAGGQTVENILVGDKSWSKDGDQWHFAPVMKSDTAFTTYDDVQGVREKLACVSAPKGLGKPVRSYTYQYNSGSGPLQVALAFEVATGLPQKMVTTDAQGRQVIKVRYTFDRSIRIAAPQSQ